VKKPKNIIFLCSSLIDIPEILFAVENHKNDRYQIIVSRNKIAYNFFLNFFEKEKIIYLNSKLNNNPRNIFLWIYELYIIFKVKLIFINKKIDRLYLYSPLYDTTSIFISLKLFKNAEKILNDSDYNEGFEEYSEQKKNNLLNKLYSILYCMPLSSYKNYRLNIFRGGFIPGIPKKIIDMKFKIDKSISIHSVKALQQSKYLIKSNFNDTQNKTIILDQNLNDFIGIKDFDKKFSKIYDVIKSDTVLKTSETIRNSAFIKYKIKKLDFVFPIEYYDISNCRNIICIFTSGIGRIVDKGYNKISLIELFDFLDEDEKKHWKSFMKKIDSNIIFPKSTKELELIINESHAI